MSAKSMSVDYVVRPGRLTPVVSRVPSMRVAGFTLIELMIVVAVLAILAAIAYPSYQDQIRKSRRGQAKADLAEYAQQAERWHTVNNSYLNFALPAAQSPREVGATASYNLALSTQTANTFVITATAVNGQQQDRCGDLSLSQAGVKTKSGVAALSECW